MDRFLQWIPTESPWFMVGLLTIIGIPLLLVIFNELNHKLGRKEERLLPPFNLIRNVILPLIAIMVVLTQILDYSRDFTIIKIVETIIWILAINAFLAIINVLVFSGGQYSLFKSKVPQLFLDIFRVAMVLLGVAIVLSAVWGADLGKLVTALGLGSFVLGLALQDTLGNLFSGIALVYEKPFRVGDIIKVGDTVGRVIEMNWRAVRLETREKVTVVIPHLVIGHEKIENLSTFDEVVVLKQLIGFSYDNPPNAVKDAILKTCQETIGILSDPIPEVKTLAYDDYKITYEIEFAIHDWMNNEEVLDDLMSRIWYTAKREGLIIPFPQMQLAKSREDQRIAPSSTESYNNFLDMLPKLMPISQEGLKANKDGFLVKYFGKGETIIKTKDPTGTLYIIMEGDALIISPDSQKIIQELHKGDFFGDITLFTDKTSSYNVMAITDLIVLVLPPSEAMQLVQSEPRLASFLDNIMDMRREKVK